MVEGDAAPPCRPSRDRRWIDAAIRAIDADMARSAETHLLRFPRLTDHFPGVSLYFKDETTHPTGSLKHRLARSLFLYALCNEKITGPDTPVFEASSGSTAISEAYFARLIGLGRYYAVIPDDTALAKQKLIESYGGRVIRVRGDIVAEARALADEAGGHFMDQFTHSERATDWRGNNNIAETIYGQMVREPDGHRVPAWIVCGAGTGGTSATIARYARYRGHATKVCVVDPDGSTYLSRWADHWDLAASIPDRGEPRPSAIEGIGRKVAAASFLPEVIEAMVPVPDDASIGAMKYLYHTGMYYCGPSSGTNLIGAIAILRRMIEAGETGSVVTILCDLGLRYADTYHHDENLYKLMTPANEGRFRRERVDYYERVVRSFFEDGRLDGLDDPAFRAFCHE